MTQRAFYTPLPLHSPQTAWPVPRSKRRRCGDAGHTCCQPVSARAAVVLVALGLVPVAVFLRPIKDLRSLATAGNAYWQPSNALCGAVGVVPVPAVPMPSSASNARPRRAGRLYWTRRGRATMHGAVAPAPSAESG